MDRIRRYKLKTARRSLRQAKPTMSGCTSSDGWGESRRPAGSAASSRMPGVALLASTCRLSQAHADSRGSGPAGAVHAIAALGHRVPGNDQVVTTAHRWSKRPRQRAVVGAELRGVAVVRADRALVDFIVRVR